MKMISTFAPPTASLSQLEEGKSGVLTDFDVPERVADHLMNLGFIPGVEVTATRSAPGGDPRIYRVDGAEVAMRSDLAARITIGPLDAPKRAAAGAAKARATGGKAKQGCCR